MPISQYRLINRSSTSINDKTLVRTETVFFHWPLFLKKRIHRKAPNNTTKKSRTLSNDRASSSVFHVDAALKRLDDISNTSQTSLSNTHEDHFGKYIASMLRNLPFPASFLLQ